MGTLQRYEGRICAIVILAIVGWAGKLILDLSGYTPANVFWTYFWLLVGVLLIAACYRSTPVYLASEIRKEIRQGRAPRSRRH